MTDHEDIDRLAENLPAVRPPVAGAPFLARLWWAVRTLWSRVHIRQWRAPRGFGGYRANRSVNPATIIPPRSPSAVTTLHGNRDLAALDATSARLWADVEDLRERKRRETSGVDRLTALVNAAKDTPIPALDDLAAAIQADRTARVGEYPRLTELHRRLCCDPPSVTASEIFDDLGIDPNPPPATLGMVQGVIAAATLATHEINGDLFAALYKCSRLAVDSRCIRAISDSWDPWMDNLAVSPELITTTQSDVIPPAGMTRGEAVDHLRRLIGPHLWMAS